jgi:hypothetical protein
MGVVSSGRAHLVHFPCLSHEPRRVSFKGLDVQRCGNTAIACEPPAGPVPQPPSPSGLFCDQNANIGVDIFILIVGFMSGSTCKQISRRWRPGWAIKSSVEYLLNFLNSGRERSLQMEKVRFASWTDEGIELWIEKYKCLWLRAVYQYDGEGVFR